MSSQDHEYTPGRMPAIPLPDGDRVERSASGGPALGPRQAETSSVQDEHVPISIVSKSQLLCEGLAALLACRLTLQLVGTYGEQIPGDASLNNPLGHVILLDGGLGRGQAIAWT